MAEEHGFQAPEGHRLCANNCGFFGSPATQHFCPECYRDLNKDTDHPKPPPPKVDSLFALPSSSSTPAGPSSSSYVSVGAVSIDKERVVAPAPPPQEAEAAQQKVAQPNRCSSCRKKVGLTGFRCRCGVTFCGTHRYPDQHGCAFDFKSMGREAIASANPLIKAKKLEKI